MYFPLLIVVFFCILAIAAFFNSKTRGFSFTLIIFAAVAASISFPEYFTGIGEFKFKQLIIPLLMIIMFGMGTAMSVQDFVNVAKMPKGVLIGLLCQFSIMPIVGFILIQVAGLPPEIAAGVILVGCSPSGLASNVMAYISGANLALSLT